MSKKNIKKEQEERAARLHQQIADLKKGNLPAPEKFNNPRDFIADKMKELSEKEQAESGKTEELPSD